jgi:hypothetical protein
MGILDELFGRNYAVDKVPSPKEMMDNALEYELHNKTEAQYIEYPLDSSEVRTK